MRVLLAGLVCLVLLGGLLFFLFRRKGTVYIVGDMGYTAYNYQPPTVHHTTQVQFERVISLFLPGDRFDMLWVSRINDEYSGLMLDLKEGAPTLSVYFKTHSQQGEIAAFRQAMRTAGFAAEESSAGFNGGMSEENRQTDFEFTPPKSQDAVLKAVAAALAQLQPAQRDGYYLSGSRFADGPAGAKGIVIRNPQDPLEGVSN